MVIKWLGLFRRKFHSPAHTPTMVSINSVVFILNRLHKIRYRFMPPMLCSIATLCCACSLFICFCWSLNWITASFLHPLLFDRNKHLFAFIQICKSLKAQIQTNNEFLKPVILCCKTLLQYFIIMTTATM